MTPCLLEQDLYFSLKIFPKFDYKRVSRFVSTNIPTPFNILYRFKCRNNYILYYALVFWQKHTKENQDHIKDAKG